MMAKAVPVGVCLGDRYGSKVGLVRYVLSLSCLFWVWLFWVALSIKPTVWCTESQTFVIIDNKTSCVCLYSEKRPVSSACWSHRHSGSGGCWGDYSDWAWMQQPLGCGWQSYGPFSRSDFSLGSAHVKQYVHHWHWFFVSFLFPFFFFFFSNNSMISHFSEFHVWSTDFFFKLEIVSLDHLGGLIYYSYFIIYYSTNLILGSKW